VLEKDAEVSILFKKDSPLRVASTIHRIQQQTGRAGVERSVERNI
jgi:hypothetical protein